MNFRYTYQGEIHVTAINDQNTGDHRKVQT